MKKGKSKGGQSRPGSLVWKFQTHKYELDRDGRGGLHLTDPDGQKLSVTLKESVAWFAGLWDAEQAGEDYGDSTHAWLMDIARALPGPARKWNLLSIGEGV